MMFFKFVKQIFYFRLLHGNPDQLLLLDLANNLKNGHGETIISLRRLGSNVALQEMWDQVLTEFNKRRKGPEMEKRQLRGLLYRIGMKLDREENKTKINPSKLSCLGNFNDSDIEQKANNFLFG